MISKMNRARNLAGGTTEYFFGWLIGIPIPILLLIYMIRGH